ncbi:hypothetical protein FA95DRAFT_285875 [Auriscalpium vulgare]|uniref:Uncharacterized protein n=1 Tax=Auriscalpium vulgare TaxID=40419 RepID=A0ACB8RKR1_9AGAM|nr:hypothetical protein FA95DRAFT_285875 [Auriscalpium vulgare]
MLTSLPVEALGNIAACITSPIDIVAFALTSKTLAAIASPRHTRLRKIVCSRFALCVWQLLATSPSLARNVRFLTICDRSHRGQVLPTSCMRCAPGCGHGHISLPEDYAGVQAMKQAERVMIAALKNMSNLVLFDWQAAIPNKIVAHNEPDKQDVWSSLAAITSLDGIVVSESDRCPMWDSQLFSLSNLTVFDYTTSISLGPSTPPDCSRLVAMLRDRCPGLEELYLRFTARFFAENGFSAPDLGESLFTARWPNLTAVGLKCVVSTPAAVVSFLAAHPGLRRVHMDKWFGCRRPLSDDFEDFDWDSPIALRLALPRGVLPDLETLHCIPRHAIDIVRTILSSPATGGAGALTISVDVARQAGMDDAALDEFVSVMKDLPPNITVANRADVESAVGEWKWWRILEARRKAHNFDTSPA